jgi:hypothetical protein
VVKRKSKQKKSEPKPAGVLFKVVEISTVDESMIEEVVNTWVARGWHFDGMQFAMRESSKRPAMAFVFFNRPASQTEIDLHVPPRSAEEAERHLMRLAKVPAPTAPPVSAYERLIQLAEGGDEE